MATLSFEPLFRRETDQFGSVPRSAVLIGDCARACARGFGGGNELGYIAILEVLQVGAPLVVAPLPSEHDTREPKATPKPLG